MERGIFLAQLAAAAAVPQATASPGDDASPDDSGCIQNPVLPYDKKLEMTDSVLDGPAFKLSAYRGFAVWINIFATWCGPCREEQAFVVEAAAKYAPQGLRTFGIFADEPDDAVRAYRKKYAIPYPLIRDGNAVLTTNLQGGVGRTIFPAHLFILPTGLISCYSEGTIDPDQATAEITAILPGATPAPSPVSFVPRGELR